VLQCVAASCSVLQCVAVCCSVLQCVAVCCSVLQCVAVCQRVEFVPPGSVTKSSVCVCVCHWDPNRSFLPTVCRSGTMYMYVCIEY